MFNVGTGQANTWIDLATAIFEALDLPPDIEFIDMPEALRGKYQYFTQADLTKLRGYFKSVEITPLKEAVSDYVQNYLIPDRRLGDEIVEATEESGEPAATEV